MLLKRKRSDDELSTFSGGGGGSVGLSSPMRSDNGDVVMMDTSPDTAMLSPSMQSRSRSCTPSHLPSRTFKRLRNGRPSDDQVHQNTLKILFQAQQQPPQPHHVFSPPATPVSMPSMPPPQSPVAASAHNQPSLHSFWKIPASASASASPQSQPACLPNSASTSSPSVDMINRPTTCEDCGVGLSEEDAMMDDGYGFETYINTCSACSRAVCFSCSVSNLGEQRRCLLCAGRKVAGGAAGSAEKKKQWVGGMGWSAGGVTVC